MAAARGARLALPCTGVKPMSQPQPSPERGRLHALGCRLSEAVADVSAHPYAQLGLILFCALWVAIGYGVGGLTAALSILAITLTQMVLNKQAAREAEAHR